MKKLLCFIILCSLLLACSTTKKSSMGYQSPANTSHQSVNDGSSYDKAIVIKANNEMKGIEEENKWLRQNYQGCSKKMQSLSNYKKKPYDIITIITSDGKEKEVYFDISQFFGKF